MIFNIRNPTKNYYFLDAGGIHIQCKFRVNAAHIRDNTRIKIISASPFINLVNEICIYIFDYEEVNDYE